MFTNRSCSRIIALKDRLSRTSCGTKFIAKYLQTIKIVSNELAIINAPLDEDDLIIHILNRLGFNFKEFLATIRARETLITFEKLYDKLIDYKTFLKQKEATTNIFIATVNFTQKCRIAHHRNSPTYPHLHKV